MLELLETNAGGLRDLTTAVASQFDESTPDSDGVRYIEVAGDALKAGQELLFFRARGGDRPAQGGSERRRRDRSSALREGTRASG